MEVVMKSFDSVRQTGRCHVAVIALSLLALCVFQNSTEASTYVVDREDDPVVVNIFDKCNIAANDCSLRTAIRRANANTGVVDTVAIPPGTYTLSVPGVDENNALWGDLDITEAVTITSLSSGNAGNTIIDGGGIDRVFHILSSGTGVVSISGVTIRNGSVDGYEYGGGIKISGRLTLEGVDVTGNSAHLGGGISIILGIVTIQNGSHISDNIASDTGGGLYAEYTELAVSDTTISGNQAVYGGGLALNEVLGGPFSKTVERSTISGNTATWGGGAVVTGFFNPPEFVNCSVSYNSASQGEGGVFLDGQSKVSFHSTTMLGNSSPQGPSLYADWAGVFYFTNNVIVGSCGEGEGVEVFDLGGNVVSPKPTCQITDSVVPDVMLTSLGDFGGSTMSHLPLVGSPVIGAGADCSTIGEDQRGRLRPVGACDAGSVERQPDDPDPTFMDGFESGDTSYWD
jgi:hypothetical protein